MDEKFVGIDSIVGCIVVGGEEFFEVKVVEKVKDENDVSYKSALGDALMFHKSGDMVTVKSPEPYQIQIINIVNPVQKPTKPFIPESAKENRFFVDEFVPADVGNYANVKGKMCDGLEVFRVYGTVAKDIYYDGYYHHGWDYSKRVFFDSLKILYATDCTRDGYSVWFLPYSNINNFKNPYSNWTNFVSSDFKVIKEYWHKIDERFEEDTEERITFVKQKNGEYVYLGIFQVKEWDREKGCKIYYKVGSNYHC